LNGKYRSCRRSSKDFALRNVPYVEQKSRSKPDKGGELFMEKNRDNPNNALPQDYLQSCYEELVIAMLELMMKDLTIPDSEIQVSLHDSETTART